MQESVAQHAKRTAHRSGAPLQIRVGLNSGEVVVRSIGSDLNMDYTAVGETTHLAARMEQLADPGATLLTTSTRALAEGFVQVTPLGPLAVNGLAVPVEVFRLSGINAARSRLQAAAARGLSPFVGREMESEHLQHALEQTRQGRGQVVAVVGEPGVGKSRVAFELPHSRRVEGWLILEAGGVAYGTATSYLPLVGLLKGYFRIGDGDRLHEIREKVTARILALDRGLAPALPALLALLDAAGEDPQWQALDPAERRQRTLNAVKRLLLREAQAQPLLVVFEDLHWIDGETQSFLDSLVESLGPARVLLLVNYRPQYQHRWGSKSSYIQLRLDPLPPESAHELLRKLLGEDATVAPLGPLLIERTEGNPFFLEESVRTLVETGALAGERGAYRLAAAITDVQVPPTVQTILAARIDRLPPEEKRLLQSAAVVGKDVPFTLLAAILNQPEDTLRRGLEHLQAAELLYETSLIADGEYTFKHALTHEVAYGGLLQERRRDLHARIVAAIVALHGDRLAEWIERLAYHAVRGELREQAVHYLRQAGLKAAARSAVSDARVWLEQALGVLEALPEGRFTLEQAFEIRLELRPVLNQLGEVRRTLERLREAETLAERLGDDHRRGRVCAFMANIQAFFGELAEASASGVRALEIATRLEDLQLRVVATTYLEQVHYLGGDARSSRTATSASAGSSGARGARPSRASS